MVGTSVSLMLMMVAFVTDVGGGWWWRWGGLSVTVVGTMALRRWCYYLIWDFGLKIWVLLLAKTNPFKEIQRKFKEMEGMNHCLKSIMTFEQDFLAILIAIQQ